MRKRKHRIPKHPNRRKPAATPLAARGKRGSGINPTLMDQLIDVTMNRRELLKTASGLALGAGTNVGRRE